MSHLTGEEESDLMEVGSRVSYSWSSALQWQKCKFSDYTVCAVLIFFNSAFFCTTVEVYTRFILLKGSLCGGFSFKNITEKVKRTPNILLYCLCIYIGATVCVLCCSNLLIIAAFHCHSLSSGHDWFAVTKPISGIT